MNEPSEIHKPSSLEFTYIRDDKQFYGKFGLTFSYVNTILTGLEAAKAELQKTQDVNFVNCLPGNDPLLDQVELSEPGGIRLIIDQSIRPIDERANDRIYFPIQGTMSLDFQKTFHLKPDRILADSQKITLGTADYRNTIRLPRTVYFENAEELMTKTYGRNLRESIFE